jgi:8-oxo-dGTP pyrophosphatase MutT (NUDIX family)
MNDKNFEKVYCGNCGLWGHSYRRCVAPITSLGVIVYKMINNTPQYLMIQRKDTLGFVEFMRGKYNIENINYVYKLFEIMTKKERDKIQNNEFDYIWNELWMNKNTKQYRNEYDTSKKKFFFLKNGINIDGLEMNFKTLNESIPLYWDSPEWGFPKGRRNMKEKDKDCATREFTEETGINDNEYELCDATPFTEVFLGSNNIRYKHIYFLGKYISNKKILVDKKNHQQISEISNIDWFDIDQALDTIRPYNVEKKNVIKKIHEYILSNQ